MKRLASFLLALCMAFSMAVPAFAEGEASSIASSTDLTGLVSPIEDESVSTEAESVPAEDASAPSEAESVPAEDASAPSEAESVPAEDTSAPSEAESVPAEDASAPSEAESVPAEDASAPTETETVSDAPETVSLSEEGIAPAANSNTAYLEVTELSQITDDGVYVIADCSDNKGTILYNVKSSSKSDQVTGDLLENELKLAANFTAPCQTWSIQRKGDSFTIQGKDSGTYIHLNAVTTPDNQRVPVKADAQELTISKVEGGFTISHTNGDQTLYVTHEAGKQYFVSTTATTLHIFKQTAVVAGMSELKAAAKRAEDFLKNAADFNEESKTALQTVLDAANTEIKNPNATEESVRNARNNLNKAIQAMTPVADKIAEGAPANGKTEGQPFPAGLAGSDTFRIPAITTLQNGWLAAAIDARWNRSPDGDNIDTLFSVSKDNGKTWEYSFPNFFNDSVNQTEDLSTAFIDPVMVQGKDGTIYLMLDLFPAGNYILTVDNATGYEKIDDVQRLVLYTSVNGHNSNNYAYYVGDFTTVDGKAFAPVIDKNDKNNIAYYVDDHYYLYTADKKPMYCRQLGSDKYVKQNVFFYNADLHVRNATYLWLVTSKDNGATWSAPTIMNPQVRPSHDGTTHRFYGVGPGAGLALDDGTVMLPCYAHAPEKSSFIYTRDNGKTWKRSDDATTGGDWSSENALVQIDATTVRQFCRDGHSVLRYTDHVWDEASQTWKRSGEPVPMNDIPKTSANQLSAIRYSKKINGKPVIMVSTATMPNGRRTHGKIYTFNLNEDKSMTLIGTYEITKPGVDYVPGVIYGYSSLTEQKDGSIGLLYEDTFIHGTYLNIPLYKLIPGVTVDGQRTFDVPLFGIYEDTLTPVPSEEDLEALDSSIVTAQIKDGKVIYTGVKEGTTSFTSNGVTITIHVVSTYPTEHIKISCHGEHKITVGPNPVITNNSKNITTTLEPTNITGGQGTTGTDKSYNGEHEALALSLYTFKKDGNGFQVSASTADGTMTWVNPAAATGYPFSTQATSVQFVPNGENTFFLLAGESRYLYFWPNRENQYSYDAVSSTNNFESGCSFKLYRLADKGETSSTEIPGYVLTNKIEDGGKYLIVSEVNGGSYVMRPSTSGTDRYAHVVKADPKAEQISATVSNVLTFKSNGAGVADILVGGTVYQISAEHKLTRVDPVEPTLNTPGNVLHWKCEIDGELFLDKAGTQPVSAKDVVIPAGAPLTPITPSKPVPSDTPLTPLTPASPVPTKKPDVPQPTEKPSQPDNNNSNNAASSTPAPTAVPTGTVATGDTANLGLWIAVIVLAGVGIVGITYLRKHKKDE